MRISEAYYIAADCMKKKGDLPHAIEYLNVILNKRGATPLAASASASEFDQQLKLEYLREFWGEGQIFFMFKRTFSSIGGVYNGNISNQWSSVNPSATVYVLPTPSSEKENR